MRAVVLAALIVSNATWSARCGDLSSDEMRRVSLRGVGPFDVVVEELHDDATRNGLDEDSIKAAVELRLRRNAVRLGGEEVPSCLYINIIVVATPERSAFSVDVEFQQPVTVDATGERCQATTYSVGRAGFCHPSDLREQTSDSIAELVDQFINDFLAANEKVGAGAGR